MIVRVDTALGWNNTLDRVRVLLSLIPKVREGSSPAGFGFQLFHGIRLVTPKGEFFLISIQGSEGHYSTPRDCLPNLGWYEAVEIGIRPDKRSRSNRFQLGTTYDWDTEGRRPVKEGEMTSFGTPRQGWLMPSDIGFDRVQDNQHDDVLGYVPVKDLVADLADFFIRGGTIEGDHPDNKEWIQKLAPEQLAKVG